MSRRLLFPAVLAAVALSAAPAFAGEDDPIPAPTPAPIPDGGSSAGSATLHSRSCVSHVRTKQTVTGELIASVAFFVDGDRMKTVTEPDSAGRFSLTMACTRLSVGAHRGKAVVTFEEGTSPASETLRFQITRSRQQSPRFAD